MSLDDTNPFKKLDKSLFPDEDGKSSGRSSGSEAGKSGIIIRKASDKQAKHSVKGVAPVDVADAETDIDFLRAMAGVARIDSGGGKIAGRPAVGKGAGSLSADRSGARTATAHAPANEDGLVSMAELEAFRQVVGKGGAQPLKASKTSQTSKASGKSLDQLKGLFKGDSFQKSPQSSGEQRRPGSPDAPAALTSPQPPRSKDRTSTRISDDVRKRTHIPEQQAGSGGGADMMEKPEHGKEDGEAFLQAMQGVEGISAKGRDICKKPELARPQPAPHAAKALQDLLDGSIEFQLEYSEEYIQGHVSGFDPMELGKMRSGHYSPEAHLDLHGMVAPQAYEALIFFMRTAYHKGLRTVLLIPGRGLNSPDGFGVLREKIQQWLTHDPFKRIVLAFCTAQPRDGGAGAVYVMLRKFKKSRGKIQWDRTPADPDLYI